jgi:ELWxxDGT repeat protein
LLTTAVDLVSEFTEGDVGSISLHGQSGDTVYFSTGNGTLWRTDGTSEGTRQLKEFDSLVDSFTNVGDTVFFRLRASELWKTDGTTAGTVRVRTLGGSII